MLFVSRCQCKCPFTSLGNRKQTQFTNVAKHTVWIVHMGLPLLITVINNHSWGLIYIHNCYLDDLAAASQNCFAGQDAIISKCLLSETSSPQHCGLNPANGISTPASCVCIQQNSQGKKKVLALDELTVQ